MTTITDIARRLGVSRATVSKALNGAPDISPETAERVRKAAAEMDYLPNATARTLKLGRSNGIGVLFVDKTGSGLSHEYFSRILESIKSESEQRGYDITLITKDIGSFRMDYLDHVNYRRCDGVVIASVDFTDPSVIRLVESDVPTVTLDRIFPGHTAIMSDNATGMASLVRHVYEKGHRRIAFIHGEDTYVTQTRLQAFRAACSALGIPQPDVYLRPGIYHDTAASAKETAFLMRLPDPPTCILYPDDYSYIGGMNELERMGLSVPGDVSAAGFDGIPLGQALRPRLTTYRQDTDRIGRLAAEKLIEEIERPEEYVPEVFTLPGELLPGKTVAEAV